MFTGKNQFIPLVEDGDACCYEPVDTLRGKLNNFQCRIECVARVNFFQELTAKFGESNEHFSDVVGKQRGARCGKREHLKPVHDWSGMAVPSSGWPVPAGSCLLAAGLSTQKRSSLNA